ncbi:hypothetical protein HB662_02015 [Roseomonas frigidaquae]|uniref:Tripartite tricarboxylate transporter substrate binding protein n=1 Tax=Falsiroseomonas frigidaquae TaxID=487318 RepID=A0ABX1ESF3_9PROT|nr:hypothetical protein [Falsiroseomonas frigidaquae]NKE43536.1 hypothetical protein [Falsiroseomonas frigidaquae]
MGPLRPTRRVACRLLSATALAALAWPGAARSTTSLVPEAVTLLAPGPEGGMAERLATRAAAALARGLVRAAALRVSVLGGADGITAANRFASSTLRDGPVLLMLPGLAVQAQLVGDPRARYEPRHWPGICGSVQPSLLALRPGAPLNAPLRVALPSAAAPEAAALLALDLLGRANAPVFCPPPDASRRHVATEAAVQQGVADGLVLSGTRAEARAAELGLIPVFAFDGAGHARDPALPNVPALGELLPETAQPDLLAATRAAAAALRARALLVLPALTSADVVALWRGAARTWPEEAPEAPEAGTRRIGPGETTLLLGTLCPPPDVALAYRLWLLRRLNYRSS